MKTKSTKHASKTAGILVIIAGVLLISGMIAAVAIYNSGRERLFIRQKRAIAERLYNSVISHDLINNFPDTPEEVMEINNNIFRLIHGNMLLNDELLQPLLIIQRQLYSDAFRMDYSFESQYSDLKETFELFRALGTICHDVLMEPPVLHPDIDNIVTVEVTQRTNNLGDLRWIYYLERENESAPYKIIGWRPADGLG